MFKQLIIKVLVSDTGGESVCQCCYEGDFGI